MILQDITQAIGHTPLVRLSRLAPNAELFAKLEYFSPGGSIKDRAALSMIEDGEARGLLKPGATIVEASGGNTGIGLALVAAVRGYKCVIVLPDSISPEKQKVLRALGAEVVLAPADAPEDSPDDYVNRARHIAKERNAFATEQHDNPANAAAHYRTTGPEIVRDTEGRLDAFICAVGSQGTLSGNGRYLREKIPGCKIIAVLCTADSSIEGVFDAHDDNKFVPDEVISVRDDEAFAAARLLAQKEGVLGGASAGMAAAAALRVLDRYPRSVMMVPDTLRNYLSADWL